MYTQCPDCQTRFRVTAAALRAAHGTVRCGRCGSAFDALPRLTDATPRAQAALPALPMDLRSVAGFATAEVVDLAPVIEAELARLEATEFDVLGDLPAESTVVLVDEGGAGEDITLEGEGIQVGGPAAPGSVASPAGGPPREDALPAAPREAADEDLDDGIDLDATDRFEVLRIPSSAYPDPQEAEREFEALVRRLQREFDARAAVPVEQTQSDEGTAGSPSLDTEPTIDQTAILEPLDESLFESHIESRMEPRVEPYEPGALTPTAAEAAAPPEVLAAPPEVPAAPPEVPPAPPEVPAATPPASAAAVPEPTVPPGPEYPPVAQFPAMPDAQPAPATTPDEEPAPVVASEPASVTGEEPAEDSRPEATEIAAEPPAELPAEPPAPLSAADAAAPAEAQEQMPARVVPVGERPLSARRWRPAPEELEPDTAPARSVAAVLAWSIGSLLLALALGAQAVHHYRQELARDARFAPTLRAVYERLGLPLPPGRDLGAIELRQSGEDVREGGRMLVRASLTNRALFEQPLPLLRLQFEDRYGVVIAVRDFEPADYLADPARAARPLAPGETSETELALADPGPDAVGYRLEVCLQESPAQTICASGPG